MIEPPGEKNVQDPQDALLMGEIQTSVSFTSVMAAVVVFFAGLQLAGNAEVSLARRTSLLMLFLAAFGFLYATLFYANCSATLARPSETPQRSVQDDVVAQLDVGDAVSEYLGVYPLVVAIPLAVLAQAKDEALAIAVLLMSLIGIWLYHRVGHTMAGRHLQRPLVKAEPSESASSEPLARLRRIIGSKDRQAAVLLGLAAALFTATVVEAEFLAYGTVALHLAVGAAATIDAFHCLQIRSTEAG